MTVPAKPPERSGTPFLAPKEAVIFLVCLSYPFTVAVRGLMRTSAVSEFASFQTLVPLRGSLANTQSEATALPDFLGYIFLSYIYVYMYILVVIRELLP